MIKRVYLNLYTVYNTKYNILIVSYRHQKEQEKVKIEFYVLYNQNEVITNYIGTESYDEMIRLLSPLS